MGRASALRSWRAPVVGALIALALSYGLCVGLVAWGHKVFPSADAKGRRIFSQYLPALQGGAAVWYTFQRVPMNISTREAATGGLAEHGDARVTVSPIGGLLLIGLTLGLAGFAATAVDAKRDGRNGSSAGRTALAFGSAAFVLSFVLPHATNILDPGVLSRRATTVRYSPSHVGAFIWPLLWAWAFGSLGTRIARRRRSRAAAQPNEGRETDLTIAVRAALSGIAVGSTLVLAAVLTTGGVAIAQHPAGAGEVLGSGRNVAGLVEGTILGLPHATAAGLVASMGVPARFAAGEVEEKAATATSSGSAGIFGAVSKEGFGSTARPVPRYAIAALGIAAIFTMVTGYRAASGAGGDRRRAIRLSLQAASVLTVLIWVIAYFVGGRARLLIGVMGEQELVAHAGASRVWLLILPIVWTVGGGLIGAALRLQGHREPISLPARGPSRRKARSVLGGAAVTSLVIALGIAASTILVDQSPAISAGRTGWNIYRDPKNGWTMEVPDSWHAYPISASERSIYTSERHGVLVSNVEHRFVSRGIQGFDMRGLPSRIVALQVEYFYPGSFVMTCRNTPLPLSLARAKQSTSRNGVDGTAVETLDMRFVAQGVPLYGLHAWIGSEAPRDDRAKLDQIVASISFKDAAPGLQDQSPSSLTRECLG